MVLLGWELVVLLELLDDGSVPRRWGFGLSLAASIACSASCLCSANSRRGGGVLLFLRVQLSSFAPLWPLPRSAHIPFGRCGCLLFPVRTPGKLLPLCCWVSIWTMTVFPVVVRLHPRALLPFRFPLNVVYCECEVPWLRVLPFP